MEVMEAFKMDQMTLEKLSIGQIMQINARAEERGEKERIYVMTPEELELYKGNCNETISTALETIEKATNKHVITSQQTLIKRYKDELKLVQSQLDKIKAEMNELKIETSSIQVELIDGQIVLLGVQELADFLGWDKRKVSVYNQRGKFETPKGRAGNRPLWLLSQAQRIKEKFV